MKNLTLLFFLFLGINSYAQIECAVNGPQDDSSKGACDEVFIPDQDFVNVLPRMEIDVVFHFQAKANGVNFSQELPATGLPPTNGYSFASGLLNDLNFTVGLWIDEFYTNPNTTPEEDFLNSNLHFKWANGTNEASVFFYAFTESVDLKDNALNIVFRGDELASSSGSYHKTGFTFGYHVDALYLRNAQRRIIEEQTETYPVDNWSPVILHEIGHTMGLRHSFNNTNTCDGIAYNCSDEACGQACHNNDSNNGPNPFGCSTLTMGYGQQRRLTLCEMSNLWEANLDHDKVYRTTVCEPNIERSVELKDGGVHVWDSRVVLDGDLIISNNTELTISCTVFMGEERKIVVEQGSKLIVDEGTITSLCDSPWRGIEVYGGDPGYAVSIINNSTIENTSDAAVDMFATGGWLLGDGNAHVKFENSTFNNCKRALAMGAREASLNFTIVDSCTVNNGKWGVTNWNCYRVQITNSQFNNITNECIVTERGQFYIGNNVFNSGRADILFANVNPGFGTVIVENQFNGLNTGIRAFGSSLGQHEIVDNQFFTGEFDVFMDGDNHYWIENNDLTADFGITSISNGNHSNNVLENNIFGNFIGLLPSGTNSNYLFYKNCFNTSFVDVFIDGRISPVQANPENFEAANNCFTHGGNANHLTFDMTGSPFQFTYIEPNDGTVDCRDAVKADSVIILEQAGMPDNPCSEAGSGTGNFPPQYNPCRPQHTAESAEEAITWLLNKIQEIENNPNLSPAQKARYISFYERCLQRVTWIWIEIKFKDGKYEEVRTALQSNNSNDAILATYASYVAENDLTGAGLYLSSLTNADDDLSDFITVQQIDLNRQNAAGAYVPTAAELNTVKDIADKKHPYAGYAKALYYWLTEEILVSELPSMVIEELEKKSTDLDTKISKTSIYPNPFNEVLTITVEGITSSNVVITDLMGRVVMNETIGESTRINTGEWLEGIYIVTIHADNKLISQDKVVLIK